MLNSVHFLRYLLNMDHPQSSTSSDERACLRRHADGKRRLVEIGVFHGVNTRAFREVMASEGVLIAVDPFPRKFFGIRGFGWARRIAHREVSRVANGKVLWVEKFGKDAADDQVVKPYLPIDFIFIDGDHSWDGIRGDWEAWSGQVAPGGVVALHDSRNRDNCGSERFTREVILSDPRFDRVDTIDSLTVVRRNNIS